MQCSSRNSRNQKAPNTLDSTPLPITNPINNKRKPEEPLEPEVIPKKGRPGRPAKNKVTTVTVSPVIIVDESTDQRNMVSQRNAELPPAIASSSRLLTSPNSSDANNHLEMQLVAIAPQKKVFISNIPSEATVLAVQNHISRSIENINMDHIEVKKMEGKPNQKHSSFVINVGDKVDVFNQLVNKELWPDHCIVQEFTSGNRKQNFHKKRHYQRRK